MVDYVTRAQLVGLTPSINESQSLLKTARARSATASTFLSYSSKDADILPAVVLILENHGASVYVDKTDDSLPNNTGRKTAGILRDRVRECRKFVNLASVNSKDSKWVPWELGLADGYKSSRNVAIFPSVESTGDFAWTEREYLGIYDRIVWGYLGKSESPLWMVFNQEENSAVTLKEWLSRS